MCLVVFACVTLELAMADKLHCWLLVSLSIRDSVPLILKTDCLRHFVTVATAVKWLQSQRSSFRIGKGRGGEMVGCMMPWR